MIVAASCLGCSATSDEDPEPGAAELVEVTSAEALSLVFDPLIEAPTTIAVAGHTWEGRPVTSFATGLGGEEQVDTGGVSTADLDALTDEQFADRMRPVRIVFDGAGNAAEYRLAKLDPAFVNAVAEWRRKQREGYRMRATGPGKFQEFKGAPPQQMTAVSTKQAVPIWAHSETEFTAVGGGFGLSQAKHEWASPFSQVTWSEVHWTQLAPHETVVSSPAKPRAVIFDPNDTRQYAPHHLAATWPRLGQVRFSSGGCSGTMIGTYTAISAAHCFYKKQVGWTLPQNWRLGHVTTWTGNFGDPFYCTTTYPWAVGPSTSCPFVSGSYSVTIPSAWITSPVGDNTEDFALVEFAGRTPGSSTGWVWPAYGVPNDYATAPLAMHAYDSDSPSPAQPASIPYGAHLVGSMIDRWASAGNAGIDATFSWRLNHYMDTEGGASGGGVLQNLFTSVGDPTLYWVGDHYGGGPTVNRARVLTASTWGFIQYWGSEY